MTPEYEAQFRNWTSPILENEWAGRRVLDAACGMGRNSVWPLKWGARELVAFDLDDRSIRAAERTLRDFPNAHVKKYDIHHIPFRSEFDIAFSIGVIHHLEDPKKALEGMVDALVPGGKLLIWVYSREGFEWIPDYVDPIRNALTSRLPLPLVHVLSYLCSVPLFCFVKIFRGPTGYFRQLSTFKFWHLHSIVFDQLIPSIAHYWTRDEVRALVKELPLENVEVIRPVNDCGWILVGKKTGLT
jgi:SAM-dependent methyltransferase